MAKKIDAEVKPEAEEERPKDDRSNRISTSVGVKKDLAHMITMVAKHRRKTHAEYLDKILRGPVQLEYDAIIAEMAAARKKSGPG